MCGILGIRYFSSKKINKAEFKAALDLLNHRGPDQQGIWINKEQNTALGNARLEILGDKEEGSQPMCFGKFSPIITYNGEVYNYKEIAKKYTKIVNAKTDTEVILDGFIEKKEKILTLLEGMFAFGIWDSKVKEFFLTRDKFGIKPLYYYIDNEKFIFSSEIEPILRFSNVNKEKDITALYDYFTYLYIPTPKTPYKNIRKIPAGHYLIYKDGLIEIKRYWDLDFKNKIKIDIPSAIKLSENLVSKSIHNVSNINKNFGLLLSGGIDSSLLLFYLHNNKNLSGTFSIGFDVEKHSELHYARNVSKYFATENFSEIVDYKMAIKTFPSIINLLEEPLGNCSVIPTYRLFNLVNREKKQKLKILISGEGGDEVFGGYNWYSWFKEKENSISPEKWTIEEQMKTYVEFLGGFTKEKKRMFFKKDVIKYFSDYDDYWSFRRFWDVTLDPFSRLQLVDIKTYLPDDLLFKGDRISSRFSQEIRFPYLNSNLVSFLSSIPNEIKNPKFEKKYLLKQIAIKKIPREIVEKKKKGFSIPFYVWIEGDFFKKRKLNNKRWGNFKNFYINKANSLEKYFLCSFLEWDKK